MRNSSGASLPSSKRNASETSALTGLEPSANNFGEAATAAHFAVRVGLVMREIENRALFLSLAVFVSLLAVVQPMRPILAAERSDTQTAANLHQQLTRHCIEEVGSDQVEVPVTQVSSPGVEEADSKPAIPDFSRETALPAWPSQPIHRKLLPPSPKDG